MNKKAGFYTYRIRKLFYLIILLAFLTLLGYLFINIDFPKKIKQEPNNPIEFIIQEEKEIINKIPEIKGLYWDHMPIKYKIKYDKCGSLMEFRIRSAFQIMQNESNNTIQFIEVFDDESLEKSLEQKSLILNRSTFNVIVRYLPNRTIVLKDGFTSMTYTTDHNGHAEFYYNNAYIPEYFEVISSIQGLMTDDKIFYIQPDKLNPFIIDMSHPDVDLLKQETKLVEPDKTTDILIDCYMHSPYERRRKYTINVVTSQTKYYKTNSTIDYATINYYNVNKQGIKYPGGCISYPHSEIKNILYIFGYEDSWNNKGILGSLMQGCSINHIDTEIVSELTEKYTNINEKVRKIKELT